MYTYFVRIWACVTFTDTTNTASSVITQNISRVIRTTGGFVISETGSVRVAFAEATRMRIVTVTDTTFQITSVVALISIWDVSLDKKG